MLGYPVATCRNLVEALELRAAGTPQRTAFSWHQADLADPVELLTYAELRAAAVRMAADLQSQHDYGERALLVFPPGLEFITAFFGCLYAGLIAVPVCPPRRLRPADGLAAIVENAEPTVVLAPSEVAHHQEAWFDDASGLRDLIWQGSRHATSGRWVAPPLQDETIALLQYTSGTTGTPKGVMVSHGNLVSNAANIGRAIGGDDHPQRAFWLPMYHDMGLIGAMVQTVFDGASSAWMAPAEFLRRPLAWLDLIARTGATFSGAPDFAYALCAQRSTPETRAGLDLSMWRVAVSGAEPVRPATIDRFCDTFADCGFRRQAFQPGYGLAEATLVVSSHSGALAPHAVTIDPVALADGTANPTQSGNGHRLTSVGEFPANQDLLIVDPRTAEPCADGVVGELWVRGPQVARGYFHHPAETEATFRATLADGGGPYLRTGDLGFVVEGHLYINGRLKELIVIRGRNLFPADIERVVRQADPRLVQAVSAVCSVELLGQERLIVIQEFPRSQRRADFEQLGQNIRVAVGRECGLEVFELLFVREGSIARTTSGKVKRLQSRDDYLAERFVAAARWRQREAVGLPVAAPFEAPQDRSVEEVCDWLVQRIGQQLDIAPERLRLDRPFIELGLGSLDVVLICDEFERWLGQRMPPTMIYDYPTITLLAERVGVREETASLPILPAAPDGLRAEVEQLSQAELDEFIAQEMQKLEGGAPQRRAA